MATTVLYRKSSGEVAKISPKGQPFTDVNPTIWGVLTDPTFTNGVENRDASGSNLGPLRQLGFQKHWDGATVRNATQPEIDGYQALQDADEDAEDVEAAKDFIRSHPRMKKILMGVARMIVTRENAIRADAGLTPISPTKTQIRNFVITSVKAND